MSQLELELQRMGALEFFMQRSREAGVSLQNFVDEFVGVIQRAGTYSDGGNRTAGPDVNLFTQSEEGFTAAMNDLDTCRVLMREAHKVCPMFSSEEARDLCRDD